MLILTTWGSLGGGGPVNKRTKVKIKKIYYHCNPFRWRGSPIYTSQVTCKSLLLHICSSICLSICLSINVSVNLSISLCIYLYIISSVMHAFWLVLTYDLFEDRRIDDVIIKTFFPYILILYYIKQIDSKLPRVCSIVDHRGRQNVVRTSVTHLAAPRVPLFCHFKSILLVLFFTH